MTIANYTPHTVTVKNDSGEWVYPPSGETARVEMLSREALSLGDGCPTVAVMYGNAQLPPHHPLQCIVSTMFADAYRRQHGIDEVELLVPDSGPSAIRENGQVVAVKALIRR